MSKIIRVACYVRVSTEEQKKHGFSVYAQIDRLKTYVNNHDEYMLVDFYIDDGVSSVKLKKRKELQRLLNDVRENKIDMILFTKLDRWGRSVKIYHQIQDVLEEHNVIWKATDEDYETQTASGKFKVNIMMSVAQQERDRDSERIKDVFEYKVKNGEAIFGNKSTLFGFKIENKKMVHDKKNEHIVYDLIDYYFTFRSKSKAMNYLKEKYDIYMDINVITRLLSSTFLYGSYRGNDNYCEPYITKERWEELQDIQKRNIKARKTNNIYIFSSLIICPHCHKRLVGFSASYKYANGTHYKRLNYRCDSHYLRHKCDFKKTISQNKIEKQLLEKLSQFMNEYIIECEMKKTPQKKKRSENSIKNEMERLNNMYLKGRIDENVYDEKYKKLEDELKDIDKNENKANTSVLNLNGINLHELYKTFTDEEKQAFWNGLLKEIYVDDEYNIINVTFL